MNQKLINCFERDLGLRCARAVWIKAHGLGISRIFSNAIVLFIIQIILYGIRSLLSSFLLIFIGKKLITASNHVITTFRAISNIYNLIFFYSF